MSKDKEVINIMRAYNFGDDGEKARIIVDLLNRIRKLEELLNQNKSK